MVTKVSSTVGVAVIWLAVVAGVSATAWFAIDRAGRNISSGSTTPNPASVGAAVGTRTPRSRPPTTGGATPSTRTPGPATTSPAIPTDRSLSVAGGQVSVRCTGARIKLRIAQPDDGWRVEVESSGPREVEVLFESRDEDLDHETWVDAVCVDGVPEISVESD